MKIDKVHNNNPTCRAILHIQNGEAALFSRISKPEWHIQFNDLKRLQENNPFDILISADKRNRLEAIIRNPDGQLMLKQKEVFFRSLFRLNPLPFITKICNKANELNQKKNI